MGNKRRSIRFDERTWMLLNELSNKTGASVSAIIRNLVIKGISEIKKESSKMTVNDGFMGEEYVVKLTEYLKTVTLKYLKNIINVNTKIDKDMGNKKKILTQKVYSRVTPETYKRLNEIKDKYGFSSVYEIVQSLIHCFLRVADRKSDSQTEPVPYDVESMFDELSSAERHVEFEKPKRNKPSKSINDE